MPRRRAATRPFWRRIARKRSPTRAPVFTTPKPPRPDSVRRVLKPPHRKRAVNEMCGQWMVTARSVKVMLRLAPNIGHNGRPVGNMAHSGRKQAVRRDHVRCSTGTTAAIGAVAARRTCGRARERVAGRGVRARRVRARPRVRRAPSSPPGRRRQVVGRDTPPIGDHETGRGRATSARSTTGSIVGIRGRRDSARGFRATARRRATARCGRARRPTARRSARSARVTDFDTELGRVARRRRRDRPSSARPRARRRRGLGLDARRRRRASSVRTRTGRRRDHCVHGATLPVPSAAVTRLARRRAAGLVQVVAVGSADLDAVVERCDEDVRDRVGVGRRHGFRPRVQDLKADLMRENKPSCGGDDFFAAQRRELREQLGFVRRSSWSARATATSTTRSPRRAAAQRRERRAAQPHQRARAGFPRECRVVASPSSVLSVDMRSERGLHDRDGKRVPQLVAAAFEIGVRARRARAT